jgi:hypothetical protein
MSTEFFSSGHKYYYRGIDKRTVNAASSRADLPEIVSHLIAVLLAKIGNAAIPLHLTLGGINTLDVAKSDIAIS